MESMAEMAAAAAAASAMPRFADGTTSMQELLRQLVESVATGIMSAEADEMQSTGTSARKVQRIAEKLGVDRLPEDQ